MVPPRATSASPTAGWLLGVGLALPSDRVARGRARHCAARPDEDAITLAAEAGFEALESGAAPSAVIFASTEPPYDEGGSVQVLCELLRLAPETFAAELSTSPRDGLAALRLGLALAQAQQVPVLICTSHAGAAWDGGDAGDGAVALLVGAGQDGGLARLTMGPSHVEELRDRWRLRGQDTAREGDSSFIHEFGGTRLAVELGRRAGADEAVTVAVCALSRRAAAKAESALRGGGDAVVERTGVLGAAHPLLRLACGLDAEQVVVAVAGGLGESVHVQPDPQAAGVAEELRRRALGGVDRDEPLAPPSGAGFDPYASGPRAWRERRQDLRLEGVAYGDRLVYPPPAAPPSGVTAEPAMRPLARSGTVLTCTRDHVYPGGDVTGMAVLELDDGSRFYCQVTMGEQVRIGDRVRLVPRRLHQGGDVVQYFWKASPCR